MATVLDLVKHYQHVIEKYPKDEQKVLKSIDKLFNLQVTVQHLQETGVGRTVNALRKVPGDVGHAARALVYKWKLMVASEESDQEDDQNADTVPYNVHDDDQESDNEKDHSRNKYEQTDKYEKPASIVKGEPKEFNGSYSGNKRKYQSSEEEEPDIKKSKSKSHTDYNNHKIKTEVQIKKEHIKSEAESDDSDHSQSDYSGSQSSESSREHHNMKVKQEIKKEPRERHNSYSSSKSARHKTKESSNTKTPSVSENHSKRNDSLERTEKHSSSKSSRNEKSSNSHRHINSYEKEKSEKSSNIDKSSHEKDKKTKYDSKSSSKHKSNSEKHKSTSSEQNTNKHKDNHEKTSSKSDKHRSSNHSQKSDVDKHQRSKEKESSEDKNKTKHISSSSKEKHSSSSKDRSKDQSSSLKEKTDNSSRDNHGHKSDKKHLSSTDGKSKHSDSKHKSDKKEDRSNESKSKHKSSSSSSHKSSGSSKSKDDVPKKNNPASSGADSDDGIDCGSGASFAEALGMVSPAKPKKKSAPTKEPSILPISKDLSPASLLAPTAKLAPLPMLEISALPEISPNYKPRPPPKLMPHFTDEEAFSAVISSKNQRTKVYSGNKVMGKIPTLYEMCVQILQEHIDALEYTGGVPYDILKPVVDRATPQQLFVLEHYNPYLMEDTDHLWQKFCEKNFRNKQRHEMESWREMYIRCQEEQEHRLKSLTANIRMTQEAKKAPIKQTKMAYVDTVVKPPRNIARKQAQHGTAHSAAGSPAARVAALAAGPNILRGSARPSPVTSVGSSFKPKKAPLMQKALQFMRGRKR